MSGFETGRFSSFKEAYEAGRAEEAEARAEASASEEEGEQKRSSTGLTWEAIAGMSEEEHLTNKMAIDEFLVEQGK